MTMESVNDNELVTDMSLGLNQNMSTADMTMSSSHLVILLGAFVPLSLCIVIGNFFVMATVYREDRLHTPTNFILTSLAFADFVTGALTIPCELYTDAETNTMNCYKMTYMLAPSYFMSGVSLMHQIIVTLDRLLAVNWPLRYCQFVTKQRVAMTIGSVWIGGTFPATAFLYVWITSMADDHAVGQCGGGAYFSTPPIRKFELAMASLVFIGLLLLTCFNLYIWRVATRQASQIRDQFRAMNADQKQRRLGNLQATKTVLGIVGTFVVSWTPVTIYFIISHHINSMELTYEQLFIINQLCFFFICVNSAINPIIYGWKNKEFRRGLLKLFKAWRLPCMRMMQKEQPNRAESMRVTSVVV
ncbi:trace amine-associated receptor 5-like [Strongylocentrotus purpuratus]|uniref:G-protein coupled receptors family 1 profile domain-containing protein n=1 Tax=Strongylocentrotus purpuratus TaxID=7668 RepID=A0A7M7NZY5_STRPU|nr:trace amine-associated receptor 5-like [Strongylocentrotus purpuratus]|eukprot:XP_011677616.1 PREDICTED: trace amine-associated receptor 5-like [Strongylocentrotus purpuratus]